MTGERTRSQRLLHETVGARMLPRHLGHRHLHTHIFAYTNSCVNKWWIVEGTQFGKVVRLRATNPDPRAGRTDQDVGSVEDKRKVRVPSGGVGSAVSLVPAACLGGAIRPLSTWLLIDGRGTQGSPARCSTSGYLSAFR